MNKPKTKNKREKIDVVRMKDIISQLSDIIYLLCRAKKYNILTILDQFTDITQEEMEILHLEYANDMDETARKFSKPAQNTD